MVARPLPLDDGTEAGWRGGGGAWQAADLMHQARVGHTATLLDDGRVLVAGGVGAPAGFPASGAGSDRGTERPPMSTPRAHHASVRIAGGAVLCTGGAALHGPVARLASVEIY